MLGYQQFHNVVAPPNDLFGQVFKFQLNMIMTIKTK